MISRLKNSSEAGVDESLHHCHSGDGTSTAFDCIEQNKLDDGVKDNTFSAGAEE